MKSIFPVLFFLAIGITSGAQSVELTKTEDKDILKIYCSQNSEELTIRFTQVPEILELGSLIISTEIGEMWKLDLFRGNYFEASLPHQMKLYVSDTVYFTIMLNERVYYTDKLIIESGDMKNLEFGKDCYLFNCSPWQDPYMPTVPDNFLIDPKANYKHKESGKIKSGKKLIYRFDACELREWEKIEI